MIEPVDQIAAGAALAEAQAVGVLPLTSACNLSCVFCSNKANPPGVRVWSLPPRPLREIEVALAGMAGLDEIVIGESASRISEGEPLTHPDFEAVVRMVRRDRPQVLLRLTTNGTLLTPELANRLADQGPVEVTVSLNTASPEAYRRLHGLAADPRRAPRALAAAGVPYEASVVAMPAVAGPDDLKLTAAFLADQGCRHLRVLVPGYSSLASPEVAGLMPSRAEVSGLVEEVRRSVGLAVSLEPPGVADLTAVVSGVLPGTPAATAGLRAGDVLAGVDGAAPFSRVDAFRRCRRALERRGACDLEVRRGGQDLTAVLRVNGGRPGRSPRPGFVLDRDVDPRDLTLVLDLARRLGAERVVVLTSDLARPVLALGLEARRPAARFDRHVAAVPSGTFGGSIASAGLLTVDDFAAALSGLTLRRGDVVFLPPVAFDQSGLDLVGRSPENLRPLLPKGVRLAVPGIAVL